MKPKQYKMIDLSEQMNMPTGDFVNNEPSLEGSMFDPLMFTGLGATANAVTKGVGAGANALRGLRTAPRGAIESVGRREATGTIGAGLGMAGLAGSGLGTAIKMVDNVAPKVVKAAGRGALAAEQRIANALSKQYSALMRASRAGNPVGSPLNVTREMDDVFAAMTKQNHKVKYFGQKNPPKYVSPKRDTGLKFDDY